MVDVLTPEQRRLNMRRIQAKNTKPELLIRKALHAKGLRYRLHNPGLSGRPDIVLPKYKTAIFVHGCFWHGHNCHLFRLPATRTEFWVDKIEKNKARDKISIPMLHTAGWKVITIWECAIRGRTKLEFDVLISDLYKMITKEATAILEITGKDVAKTE